ncbi:MAG: hypothetical protein LBR64_10775 [Dysgonamonadaceae bacterium]|jgi:hypothetical protein|nr:hypothetical protein [Dysgonamonadaceae bacterium]
MSCECNITLDLVQEHTAEIELAAPEKVIHINYWPTGVNSDNEFIRGYVYSVAWDDIDSGTGVLLL